MKKILTYTLLSALLLSGAFADDFDELFMDDGIDEMVTTSDARTDEVNHGALFETGSIKIGGTFDTSISTLTTLWADDEMNFGEHVNDTTLTPKLSAFLTLDARPTQTLRMYTKFGLAYPFKSSISLNRLSGQAASFSDYLKVKELFTDFSVADRAFFRFGLHTVTWGTGYFFSPVSDMINTSSINPEDAAAQVDGALNLRTQVTFPGTQNCLWFYIIPGDLKLINSATSAYFRETAFAAKGDLVFGGWEFGLGGYYKYQAAPKAMVTASGSIKKLGVFGEAVYQYGGNSEWKENDDWSGKTSVVQATAGIMYMWKRPSITLTAQYYYDGNGVDKLINMKGKDLGQYAGIAGIGDDEVIISVPNITQGHNFALLANFGRIFGTTDVTATVFGMFNVGKDDAYVNQSAVDSINTAIGGNGNSIGDINQYTKITSIIFSALLSYSPTESIKLSMGPYITMTKFTEPPVVSLKFQASLGGGKF